MTGQMGRETASKFEEGVCIAINDTDS